MSSRGGSVRGKEGDQLTSPAKEGVELNGRQITSTIHPEVGTGDGISGEGKGAQRTYNTTDEVLLGRIHNRTKSDVDEGSIPKKLKKGVHGRGGSRNNF